MTTPVDRLLAVTSHRPWPLPQQPWFVSQDWNAVVFLHWRVDEAALRPLVPSSLEIDTFDGAAWAAVATFRMAGARMNLTPTVPGTSPFTEANLRTFVRRGAFAGVWFFSLDCSNALAAKLARATFHLPYFDADIRDATGPGWASYRSRRAGAAPSATFDVRCAPTGTPRPAAPGFESWALDRYCVYAADEAGLLRADVHHAPWTVRDATTDVATNTLPDAAGFRPAAATPRVLFCDRQEVVRWLPERAGAVGEFDEGDGG